MSNIREITALLSPTGEPCRLVTVYVDRSGALYLRPTSAAYRATSEALEESPDRLALRGWGTLDGWAQGYVDPLTRDLVWIPDPIVTQLRSDGETWTLIEER